MFVAISEASNTLNRLHLFVKIGLILYVINPAVFPCMLVIHR